jgi:hypothetical protein
VSPRSPVNRSRLRESGLTVYGFGERKTPAPFVAACDKFVYTENLVRVTSTASPVGTTENRTRDDRLLS